MAERRKERLRELHDPRQREQQEDAHPHRTRQANCSRFLLLVRGQLASQD
jgi:hypothetical protein